MEDRTFTESGNQESGSTYKRPRSFSLRTRFVLGVGIILLCFCSISAYIIYRQGILLVESASHAKSQIVMATVEANMNYVREVLRPKIYEVLGDDAFILEAMSTSFVSRSVMDRFNAAMPEYRYRRVAVGARNPTFEANPTEARMIKYFIQNPDKIDWHGIVQQGDESQFTVYRPVRFSESCLRCHGAVEEAPRALIELYGSERGYNHKVGDIAGVISVGIPVDVALGELKGKAVSVFMSTLFVGGLLFVVIISFFNRLVANDLRQILDIFRKELPEETSNATPSETAKREVALGDVPKSLQWADELKAFEDVRARDEIDEITMAAQSMARNLNENRVQLKAYAQNLEHMVAERTQRLEESQDKLRGQVIARNRELQTLNTLAELTTQATTLREVLPRVLDQTLSLIPARGAGLYLLSDNASALELQCRHNAPELMQAIPFDSQMCRLIPDDDESDTFSTLQEAACGHISFSTDESRIKELHVPLCCRGQILGVISFKEVDFDSITPELSALLSSVGRQVGIAVESLQNVGKLLHSKELLQSIFDSITDMVVLMDRELRIRMVNKAHLKRYGLTEHDVLGRLCYDVHSGDICRFPECGLRKVFDSKGPIIEEMQGSNGDLFLMHFYPVMSETGEVESIVRYARDITEQKRMEQQIQKTEKLASLGQLAAGLAHEINNPLGVILTYTRLLKEQLTDQTEPLEDVDTIEKHALTCKRVVSDLLNFARGEHARKQLTSINRTIEEAVQMVLHRLGQSHISVQLDLDPDLPLLNMDIDKMKQVFVNLLMNSEQAIEEDGEIRISTSYEDKTGYARVIFRDNGQGIASHLLPKVFDPFFSTKATGEGTGLGLSVSYGIIRDHGGEIQASSEQGEWTEFTILLPANNAQQTEAI
jgi:two-component system, NtrC family, sensor kinase